jgi:dTDP-4-dehydrorhamnose 3,5-epimerase
MKVTESPLKGCFVIDQKVFRDERGFFFEAYQQQKFEEAIGQEVHFVQDNVSVSKKGVLRGLHFQKGNSAQSKLIQVLKGEVLDVVVDLREGSSTFGQHFKMKLSSENRKSIFIPKGMAHGFLALSESVIFSYKCDELYDPKSEAGILYNDPTLDIDWEIGEDELILSVKDLNLPLLKDLLL